MKSRFAKWLPGAYRSSKSPRSVNARPIRFQTDFQKLSNVDMRFETGLSRSISDVDAAHAATFVYNMVDEPVSDNRFDLSAGVGMIVGVHVGVGRWFSVLDSAAAPRSIEMVCLPTR